MNITHGGNIWRIAKENSVLPENIIDFSASINPLGLSQKAKEAILNAIPSSEHYPEPCAEALIIELSAYHNLPVENVSAGNGSSQLIYLIPHIFQPKKALIIEPCFSEYRNSLSNSCKTNSFICKEDSGFLPDIDKLFDEIENGYDIIYIGNPANPTGVLIDKSVILDIATKSRKHNTKLIIDESFIDFVEHNSVKKEAVISDNIIVLRSMTKFFAMPGLRLGYVIAHADNIRKFSDVMSPWSVNAFASAAGIASLRDKDYISKTRAWLQSEIPFFTEIFKDIPYVNAFPTMVNYMLVKILVSGITASDIQKQLLKNSILIRECSNFTGLDNSFFRVAIRNRNENMVLKESLANMFANSFAQKMPQYFKPNGILQ